MMEERERGSSPSSAFFFLLFFSAADVLCSLQRPFAQREREPHAQFDIAKLDTLIAFSSALFPPLTIENVPAELLVTRGRRFEERQGRKRAANGGSFFPPFLFLSIGAPHPSGALFFFFRFSDGRHLVAGGGGRAKKKNLTSLSFFFFSFSPQPPPLNLSPPPPFSHDRPSPLLPPSSSLRARKNKNSKRKKEGKKEKFPKKYDFSFFFAPPLVGPPRQARDRGPLPRRGRGGVFRGLRLGPGDARGRLRPSASRGSSLCSDRRRRRLPLRRQTLLRPPLPLPPEGSSPPPRPRSSATSPSRRSTPASCSWVPRTTAGSAALMGRDAPRWSIAPRP